MLNTCSEDLLVFLTGSEEIEQCRARIREISKLLPPGAGRIDCRPLYAALTADAQLGVFTAITKNVNLHKHSPSKQSSFMHVFKIRMRYKRDTEDHYNEHINFIEHTKNSAGDEYCRNVGDNTRHTTRNRLWTSKTKVSGWRVHFGDGGGWLPYLKMLIPTSPTYI
jgi:hypothetical protein